MNTKIWNLYKSSEEGQKLIKAFDPLREDLYSALEEIFTFAQNINKETPIEVKWDFLSLYEMFSQAPTTTKNLLKND